MNAAYRSKLKHWLTSMLVLHSIYALLFIESWYFGLLHSIKYDSSSALFVFQSIISPGLGFVTMFLLCLVWHLADFVQRDSARSRFLKLFDDYRCFLAILCLCGAAKLLALSSFLNDLGCPDGYLGFDGCGSWTPVWQMLLAWFLYFVALPVLSFGKLALSIASRFRRSRPASL